MAADWAEKKAREALAKCFCEYCEYCADAVKNVAQAILEAEAQAFEEAAKMSRLLADEGNWMEGFSGAAQYERRIRLRLRIKAKSLRAQARERGGK